MTQARKHQKTKTEIIIFLGLTLFVIGEVGQGFLTPKADPYQLLNNVVTLEWFTRFIRDTGLTFGLVGMVFLGLRSLRKEGFSYKMLLVLSGGLCCMLGVSVFSFVYSSKADELYKSIAKPTFSVERFQSKINDESIPIEDRVLYSKTLAQMRYSEEGVVVEMLNLDGTTSVYSPSEEDVKMREDSIMADQALSQLGERFWRNGVYWAVMSVVGLLLGFLPFKRAIE